MKNQYKGACCYCGEDVKEGDGLFEKALGTHKWKLIHAFCAYRQRSEKELTWLVRKNWIDEEKPYLVDDVMTYDQFLEHCKHKTEKMKNGMPDRVKYRGFVVEYINNDTCMLSRGFYKLVLTRDDVLVYINGNGIYTCRKLIYRAMTEDRKAEIR